MHLILGILFVIFGVLCSVFFITGKLKKMDTPADWLVLIIVALCVFMASLQFTLASAG